MAAKRGRGIGSFGQAFTPLGISGGRPAVGIVDLTLRPRSTALTLDPRTTGLALSPRSTVLTLDSRMTDLTLLSRSTDLTLGDDR